MVSSNASSDPPSLKTLAERIGADPTSFETDLLAAWAEDALIIGRNGTLTPHAIECASSVYQRFWTTLDHIERRAPGTFSRIRSWPPTPAAFFDRWMAGDYAACYRGGHIVYARQLVLRTTATTAGILRDALAIAEQQAIDCIRGANSSTWPESVDPILPDPDTDSGESVFFLVTDSAGDDRRTMALFTQCGHVFWLKEKPSSPAEWKTKHITRAVEGMCVYTGASPTDAGVCQTMYAFLRWLKRAVGQLVGIGALSLMGLSRLGRRCDLPAAVLRRMARASFRRTGTGATYYGAFFRKTDFMMLSLSVMDLLPFLTGRRDTLQEIVAAAIATSHPDPLGAGVAAATTLDMHQLIAKHVLVNMVVDPHDKVDRLCGIARLLGIDPTARIYAGQEERLCAAAVMLFAGHLPTCSANVALINPST